MDRTMRMIIVTGLLAIALLGAVLGAIGVHGSTWVAAGDDGKQTGKPLHLPALLPSSKGA